MRIEKYKKVKDIKIGDKLLGSTPEREEIEVIDIREANKRDHVLLVLPNEECVEAPLSAFVLLPNTMEVYILQPSMPRH
jgi:hypothetical protein